MTVTAASFKARFPTFDDVADASIDVAIEDAEAMTSRLAWGAKADRGVCLLVAHFLELNTRLSTTVGSAGTARGPVTQVSAGPVSRSYAALDMTRSGAAYWAQTPYGLEYQALLETIFAPRVCA